jgi:molybdenum cofactor cytidylyltransferase
VEGEPKWSGVPVELMETVCTAVREAGGLLVVEADGARGGSLKAPADYEPVVPACVDLLVPVAGIDVLGEPPDSELIHRPQIVQRIAGTFDRVTLDVLARVLGSPEGGLKGLSEGGRVRVLINKVKGGEALQNGRAAASLLLGEPHIDAVILGAVSETDPVQEVIGRTAGVVLAAGEAERFGGPKQVLEWKGKPFVRRAAETALGAGLSPVFVVTGAWEDQVRDAVQGLDVELVDNPAWKTGQGSSVRSAAAVLPENVEAACFLLADMPAVSEDLVRALVQRHRETLASIVAPEYEGKRGNPVLFDRRTFGDLAGLSGKEGGRQLFGKYGGETVPWDESILVDIDTREDYLNAEDAEKSER